MTPKTARININRWRLDERLRSCSYAARWLFVEMAAIMSKSSRPGFLLHKSHPVSLENLARSSNIGNDDILLLSNELTDAGMIAVDCNGVCFCPMLVKVVKGKAKARGAPKLKTDGNPLTTEFYAHKRKRGENILVPREHIWSCAQAMMKTKVLDDPRFMEAYLAWFEYRYARRKPLAHHAVRRDITRMEQWGLAAAIRSIRNSIDQRLMQLFSRNEHLERQKALNDRSRSEVNAAIDREPSEG